MSRTEINNDNIKSGGSFFNSSSNPTISSNTVNGLPLAVGQIWLNTTSGEMFSCTDATTNANVWTNIGDGTGSVKNNYMDAQGGTITTDGSYRVHTFNTSGTLLQ